MRSPELVISTAPAVDGVWKADWIMSSNARDSRGASVKVICGADAGHDPRKQRYTAVTFADVVYDVLNTRTSEKNGLAAAPTGSDVTAGRVRVSERSGGARRRASAAAGMSRRRVAEWDLFIVVSAGSVWPRKRRAPGLTRL